MTTTYIFDREPKASASDAARFGTRGNKPTKRQYANDSFKKQPELVQRNTPNY